MSTIGESASKNWLTKKEFADELNTNVNNLNQLLQNGPKLKKFPKPGPQYLQKAHRDGKKVNVYSPQYIAMVEKTRTETTKGKGKGLKLAKASMKHAAFTVTVPIFDKQIAELVMKKFSDEAGMRKFLQEKLTETVKPALAKIEELKKRHEHELKEAMKNL